jgi:hypothetical protein
VNGSLMNADVPATAPLSEVVTLMIDERTAWDWPHEAKHGGKCLVFANNKFRPAERSP